LIGRGALISGAMVMIALPQYLVIFDKLIGYTTLNWPDNNQNPRVKTNKLNKVKKMKKNDKTKPVIAKDKNRRIIKTFSMILVIAFAFTPAISNAQTLKDETIYVALDYDGAVSSIDVVNRLYSPSNDEDLVDFGQYITINNLIGDSVPSILGNEIKWKNTPDHDYGFYYQGEILKDLPYTFEITYYLNGEIKTAEKIAGQSGNIKIQIVAEQNMKCPAEVRSGLMAQIALNLDLDKTKNIVNENATKVIAGKMMTLSYTILEGSDATFKLSFDAEDFEMSGMNIALLRGEISIPDNIQDSLDEIETGFDDMAEGMDEIVDGTSQLKDGLDDVTYGARKINKGLAASTEGAHALSDGMGSLASGSTDIKNGLSSLAALGGPLAVKMGIPSETTGEFPPTSLIAQAQIVAATTTGVAQQFAIEFLEQSTSISTVALGVVALNDEYASFDAGFQQMKTASRSLYSGVNELSDGMSSFYSGVRKMPDETEKLVDGLIAFNEGIDEANQKIKDQVDDAMPSEQTDPVSFVSPENPNIQSVQYIMLTPSIEILEVDEVGEGVVEEKNIWDRFVDLFS